MKRLSWFPMAVIAATSTAILSMSSCGGGGKPDNEIWIGAYLSLSGQQATFGKTTEEGIRMAVEERNAKGGVKGKVIKLFVEDNKGQTSETQNAVKRLIGEKVDAILGEVASGQSLAAAPICQQNSMPMISPSSTNPEVTKVGDMIFRVCFIDPDQGYACAKFSIDDLKAMKAAILYDQKQPYSTGLADNFEEWYKKLGGTITTKQAYSGGNVDFSAQLTTIRDSKPGIVFIPGYYNEVPSIAIQARKLGIEVPLLGADGWETDDLAKKAEGKLEGCYYSNHYDPDDASRPESLDYQKRFKAKYGKGTSALAALGYDAANVLFDAMERAPSLSGKDLAKALAETKDFKGVTGDINFDKNRNTLKPIVILKIEGGKEKYVTTIDPPKN
ncbi:MAG: ABC transporter substrate-binding protein [Phycisphaeraceae bacterium]